jgi:Zn-dependent M16 (insulinase) family peptidase
VLAEFQYAGAPVEVPSQPRWSRPRRVSYPYPFQEQDELRRKYQACVAWLTADIQDTFEVLVLSVIEQVLLGNAGSPLRRALLESQLGTALSDGTGYDADNRDTLFACGLKEVEATAKDAVEQIVFDCLKKLAADGIDPELIEAAIHQIEFHRREVTNTPYPYGIRLLLFFTGTWIHGGDPYRVLDLDADFDRLRKEIGRGGFLEGRIKDYFLDNPHRVLLTLVPDPDLARRDSERVAAELAELAAKLSEADAAKIQQDAEALAAQQKEVEDVSVLPTLEREDIPPEVARLPESTGADKLAAVLYRQPTAGIAYFAAAAGIAGLKAELIPLMPFFCYAWAKVGTKRRDYATMARRIDAITGGVGLTPAARVRYDHSGECVPFVALSAKCLARNQAEMHDIVLELAAESDFSDAARLKQLILEYRAALEAMVLPNGHRLAISLSSRGFGTAPALAEAWQGIHQLQTVKAVTGDLGNGALGSLAERLDGIATTLFAPDNLLLALIGEDPQSAAEAPALMKMADTMAAGDPAILAMPPLPDAVAGGFEGWSTTSAVSFVASTLETVRMDHADGPALAVIAKMLRSLYLHREIREKGGAYGGFALYNPESGLFSMVSYRDPHIVATLDAFKGAGEFIRTGHYTDQDVKEAILQVCAEIDKPDPPGPAARKAFYRRLISLSDGLRDRFKRQVLDLGVDGVRAAGEAYFGSGRSRAAVAVISSEERLQAANGKLGERPFSLHKI